MGWDYLWPFKKIPLKLLPVNWANIGHVSIQKCPKTTKICQWIISLKLSKTLRKGITQLAYADEPQYVPVIPLFSWNILQYMPGIYFVVSICPAYTLTSSHTLRYQVCGPCLSFQLDVWPCGDNALCMCRFVLESAARNMKIAVVKIFKTVIFMFILRTTLIMQICIYKRNRLYMSRRKVESSQWACTWYHILRYLPHFSHLSRHLLEITEIRGVHNCQKNIVLIWSLRMESYGRLFHKNLSEQQLTSRELAPVKMSLWHPHRGQELVYCRRDDKCLIPKRCSVTKISINKDVSI